MSLYRRGQVATEFMLYTGVFMFMTVAAFIVVSHMIRNEVPLQQNIVAKETGQNLADVVTLSVKGGEGFSYKYIFPRQIYKNPYKVYLTNLDEGFMMIDWQGEYGNFSYQYDVPYYENYEIVDNGCITAEILESDSSCSNVLLLNNDGNTLTIEQVP